MFGPDAGQKKVFDGSVRGLVRDVLEGGNCLVFTYGVTNAGKTFTFLGQNLILSIHFFVQFERFQIDTFSHFVVLNCDAIRKNNHHKSALNVPFDTLKESFEKKKDKNYFLTTTKKS